MRTRLALLVLCAASAFGLDPNRRLTQYVHRIWQTQQGFSDATVYSIVQTRDGYLWLGTQGGLVRFDGVRFTPVENIYPAAPTNIWIRDLTEDPQGALWIATNESGVYRLDHGAFTHFSQKDGLPSDSISCVIAGRNGDIWIGTSTGIARFANGKIQAYRAGDGLAMNFVRNAFLARDGTLWAGGDGPRSRPDPGRASPWSSPRATRPRGSDPASTACSRTSGSARTNWSGPTAG